MMRLSFARGMFLRLFRFHFLIGFIAFYSTLSYANVVILGTRVIYPEEQQRVSVQLKSNNAYPVLVQSWIDSGDPKSRPGSEKVPFYITPPITRVEANQGQALRIMYVDKTLPQDRESIYWLNVLELPPKPEADKNYMQLALRSRIKLFFRPEAVSDNTKKAVKELAWNIEKDGSNYVAKVTNNTPHYFTYVKVQLQVGSQKFDTDEAGMVAPFSSYKFKLPTLKSKPANSKLATTWLNDNGFKIEQEYDVN